MVTFEKLVNNLAEMLREKKYFSNAMAMCEKIARMDIKDFDFRGQWIAYDKKGFGTIVLTKNRWGKIKEIRAWNEDKSKVFNVM